MTLRHSQSVVLGRQVRHIRLVVIIIIIIIDVMIIINKIRQLWELFYLEQSVESDLEKCGGSSPISLPQSIINNNK